ncbi:glycerol kinase GlpK [[Clostridium] fimetarium]|uniref:ATP:glycerol 3-phosphotransferase n=1 Tax=[Clostridium] fimetarium TaxID=99656 RepID=A0A1I0NDN3_9FIRM|nr:glycerol kinase GlpK [[Clostridium] fimetarium]SEV99409.1 glycerol kinase [[Clostridium] fimetarium]
MEKKYVLAIDQSTQGTKAILFDRTGSLVCRTDLPHKQLINEKGWVSHDLAEIYQNTIQVVKNLVKKSGIKQEEIACLGISNQRETSAAWDKRTGEPLAPAIVWQCSRAEDICERVKNIGVEEQIHQKTGMYLSPYFPAAKYAWLQENVESVKKKKENGSLCFGTIDTWLLFKLTDGKIYATDYSNASRTQLFNIYTLKWDEEICDWFGIDASMLPEVKDSSYCFGETNFNGFFHNPIPICSMIGDSQGALFGQGCIKKGMVKVTYGTGSSVMMNLGETPIQSSLGLVTSLAWGIEGKVSYVLEGNINYTGAVITWLKEDMELIKSPSETQELAFQANKNDSTYLVPAFSGLGAPFWKPEAKAIIYGMSRITGKKEIVKAALESIAYQVTDVINMMKAEERIEIKELCVDGGPTRNQYLMKFQSDILGIVVNLPHCEESSALGAAYMAGLFSGIYKREVIFATMKRNRFVPSMSNNEQEKKYNGWKNAIKKVIG